VGRSTLQSFIAERMALLKMPYGEAWLLKARVHEHVEAPSDQMQYFAEISEISSTVDFDLLQTSTAAFLISSRSSRRAASHPYPLAMETMSRPGMPGTPGASSSTANDLRMQYSSLLGTKRVCGVFERPRRGKGCSARASGFCSTNFLQ